MKFSEDREDKTCTMRFELLLLCLVGLCGIAFADYGDEHGDYNDGGDDVDDYDDNYDEKDETKDANATTKMGEANDPSRKGNYYYYFYGDRRFCRRHFRKRYRTCLRELRYCRRRFPFHYRSRCRYYILRGRRSRSFRSLICSRKVKG